MIMHFQYIPCPANCYPSVLSQPVMRAAIFEFCFPIPIKTQLIFLKKKGFQTGKMSTKEHTAATFNY